MIARSLLVALGLFVLYSLKIHFGTPSNAWGQNQFQNNTIKAQNYMYMPQKGQYIILGSSIAASLSLPEDSFQNVSFRAGSAYEGLKILQKKMPNPKSLLLIEVNTLLLPTKLDEAFAEDIFFPVFREVREYVPALQEKNQPATLVMPMLIKTVNKLLPAPKNDVPLPKVRSKVGTPSRGNFSIDEGKFAKIKQMIHNIEKNNVKIVFFEVPQDAQYKNAHSRKICLERLRNIFAKYDFIELPTEGIYNTSDGVHLDAKSNEKYTGYLKTRLNLIK